MKITRSEALEINQEILELAKGVLSETEIDQANNIANSIIRSIKESNEAFYKLRSMVPTVKRPLYYAEIELKELPEKTRSSIRGFSDYIDQLIKRFVAEKMDDQQYLYKSLGVNLRNIKGKKLMELNLLKSLQEFNKLIYVPAKHDFSQPEKRLHRFTSKEAIYTVFIVLALAKKIIPLSKSARIYSENKDHNFYDEHEIDRNT